MAEENVLDDISHRRFNPLRNSWILVSPHRTKRPWQEAPAKSTLPEYDPACYLCPGNKRAAGDVNPLYSSTFVFVNDYSAVKEDQPDYLAGTASGDDKSSLLLQAEGVKGKCFVICFNPKHNLTLADFPPASIAPIIDTWTTIYRIHLPPSHPHALPPTPSYPAPSQQFTYMQIFENKGSTMGCSNPHPHGQIWTTTCLPDEPSLELASMSKYKSVHNTCMLCDYLAVELTKRDRIIHENDSWVALVPWWATWPFEVLLLSRSCHLSLPELSPTEVSRLAEALSQVTKRYDNLFETHFPYSMGFHQAPLSWERDLEKGEVHLHAHFYPPLLRSATVRKFLVGYEMLAEPQRDITAEQAAVRLRGVSGTECYREGL
ncbi:galactose-1-phosphate uridyl transferase [Kalaharituber pfeilii]|nr:galactose-1-phosphate uridyl transferase [Kalaharituber pfeilii]